VVVLSSMTLPVKTVVEGSKVLWSSQADPSDLDCM
jgi:hypothetical protein